MAALATVEQLSAFLQQPLDPAAADALLYLDLASDMVRDFLQQQLDYTVDDVALLDPIDGAYVFLPEFPVVSVTTVETFSSDTSLWSVVDPATVTISRRLGIISALPGCGVSWPSTPESWRVTYTHGFQTLPNSILGAVLGAAARAYASPVSVDSERIGGYQVKYSVLDEGFSAAEKAGLSRYIIPRLS